MSAATTRSQWAGARTAVAVVAGVLAFGLSAAPNALADDNPYPAASASAPVQVDSTDPDLKLPDVADRGDRRRDQEAEGDDGPGLRLHRQPGF